MQAVLGKHAAWVLAVLTLLLAGCMSQPQRPVAAPPIRAQALPPDFGLYRQSLLSNVEVHCEDQKETCDVPVTMIMATGSDNMVYCAAKVPKAVNFYNSEKRDKKPKTIVWKLGWDEASFKLSVAFQETHGILLLKQDKKDQIHGGTWISAKEFHMKNKHDEKNTATYLPIILQVDDSENPTLCAAADPKIINH